VSDGRIERYRRLFEYEKDSHAKVLASLEGVAPERRGPGAYAQALSLFAHIAAARRLWLFRLGHAAEPPTEFFPTGLTLEQLRNAITVMEAAWSDVLAGMDEGELDRVFEYQSLDGPRFRNTIEDILTQLFGHSLYHRGQIALLMRQVGAPPAETDYVFWTRQPV